MSHLEEQLQDVVVENCCLSVAAGRFHYLIKKALVIIHPHDRLCSTDIFLARLGKTGREENAPSLWKHGWETFRNAAVLFSTYSIFAFLIPQFVH